MSSRVKEDLRVKEVPDILKDPTSRKRYQKGKFLGKGGFAKCYELVDMDTRQIYAGKIVSKALLTKPHQKDKMAQEIQIHRALNHKNVVGFKSFFEDHDNVYIILELCRRRSLMELHKRRRAITEPEARIFMHQIVSGCLYLHSTKVIHRDLKLGNLFLNDDMEIKIGDFGLATRVDYDGERKKTLCGTPNYIAPEVLGKKGHSYEVDAWSLGCILYTLLVGKPPFETSCLKDTYMRIKKNEFHIPSGRVSSSARNLIMKLLRAEPSTRPSMQEVMADEFFTSGYMPSRLPTSCLTMAPRFDQLPKTDKMQNRAEANLARRPLLEINNGSGDVASTRGSAVTKDKQRGQPDVASSKQSLQRQDSDQPTDYFVSELFAQVCAVTNSNPSGRVLVQEDESEDPAAAPVYWISKWVDYSDKYGLGYQLCDNSVGVLFNDSTRLLLAPCGENIQYIERDGTEQLYTLSQFPDSVLLKKVTLLKYFRNYMNEHLLKAGANMTPRDGDELARMPFLRTWFRTKTAIIMHLSNGTLQINFFKDHAKIILCPLMSAITYINENRDFRTFKLEGIEKNGCSKDLSGRLQYARTMVERLMSAKSGSGRVKSAS